MAAESSRKLRSRGNEVYSEGCSEYLAPVVRSGRLLRASKLYRQALDVSKTEDERAKCSKNLGAVHWKHAKLTLDSSDDGKAALLQDRPASFDVERSIEFYLAALRHGRTQSTEWRQNIVSNLEEIARYIADGHGWLLNKPDFVSNVKNLFVAESSSVPKSHAWAIIQLGLAQTLFDKAVKELRLRDADGTVHYRQCLSLLHRCYSPMEEAQRHARPVFLEDIETLKSSVDSCQCTCESIQTREAGKRILQESSRTKDRAVRQDLVLSALDKFKEAAVIARGVDTECEAEALACVGDLYKEVFNKEQLAHPYYTMVVHLAQNSDVMRSAKWYERAKGALNSYLRSGGEDPEVNVLPEIKGDVAKIEIEYKKQKTEEFLKYLYAEHPPRGNNGSNTLGELSNGGNTRLALRRAIQHYHPDHNAVVDDPRWMAICVEITKLLLEKHRLYQQ